MARQGQEIANPRTGQTMRFVETADSTGGALLRIETVNPPTGRPEPEHIHPEQQSSAEVTDGELRFRVDGKERPVRAGEKLVIPAGTPHTFWNAGDVPARAIQEFRPALRIEDFFETYFALARDGALDADGMPSLLQTAVLLPAYAREMRPVSPPWPLIRMLGFMLGPVARARGYRPVLRFA